MDVLRMVQQCVGMTGSSNEAEASSMALKACHAILKHKLVILLPDDPRLLATPAQEQPPTGRADPFAAPVPRPPPAHPARAQAPSRATAPPRPTKVWKGSNPFVDETGGGPPPIARAQQTSKSKPKHWERGQEPVKLTNKYPAFCKGCGVHCEPGEKVFWLKDRGVACSDCGAAALVG